MVEGLKNEAEALRKEKKRSQVPCYLLEKDASIHKITVDVLSCVQLEFFLQVSGLHHYLHLLDSWQVFTKFAMVNFCFQVGVPLSDRHWWSEGDFFPSSHQQWRYQDLSRYNVIIFFFQDAILLFSLIKL